MDFLKNRPLYLASRSPRRRQILEWAGVPHTIIDIDIEETWPEGMAPFEVPRYLAKMKAREALPRVPEGGIVLTADSVVILGNQVFGKPVDRRDAYRMLAHLSGKVHQVVTGVCLATQGKELVFDSTTDVFFRPLNHDEIEHYLDVYEPFDRAGAYGIQDWLGLTKISRIEGSFYNVMGLPMDLVYEALASFER